MDFTKCYYCGRKTEARIQEHTMGTFCTHCNKWSIVTKYWRPIELDQTAYTLQIIPLPNPSIHQIRCIAKAGTVNFLQAKRMLESGGFSVKGTAVHIKEVSGLFRKQQIAFTISPDFSYEAE